MSKLTKAKEHLNRVIYEEYPLGRHESFTREDYEAIVELLLDECNNCSIQYEIGLSRGRTQMLIEEIDADGPRFAKIIEEQRVFEAGLEVDIFFKRREAPGCDLIIKGQPAGEIKLEESSDGWVIISALGEERGRESSLLAAKELVIKLVKQKQNIKP